MTTGHPASASRARWTRERLIGLGLGADQIVSSAVDLPAVRTATDLVPAHYRSEFESLVHRVGRLLGTGRGISLYVTGGRDAIAARLHAALHIALGLTPLGRQVVIADGEFLRPGLEGLLTEPLAEGLLDMVRFGRSSRALLQRPVPDGPWLLPSGSIPADEPAPLDADALRSVVYRISQVCDLALYVGPLSTREDVHPMVRVCDHVLLASDEGAATPSDLAEALSALQAQQVHVLGAVLVTPAAASMAALASPAPIPPLVTPVESVRPGAPMETPPIPRFAPPPRVVEPAAMTPPFSTGHEPPARVWPPVPGTSPEKSPLAPPPQRPASAPSPADPLPGSELAPRLVLPPLAPEFTRPSTSDAERAFPAAPQSPRTEQPFDAPDSQEAEVEAEVEARSEFAEPQRTPRTARRSRPLPDAEFAFEDTTRFSRWPLVVVIVLLVTIVFFVGSIFVFRNRARNLSGPIPTQAPLSELKPAEGGTGGPDDTGAAQGSSSSQLQSSHSPDDPASSTTTTTAPVTGKPDDRTASAPSPDATGSSTSNPTQPAGGAAKTSPAGVESSPAKEPPAAAKPPAASAGAAVADRPTTTPPKSPAVQPPVASSPPAVAPTASSLAGSPLYSVHVASYQTLRKANVEIANLRARGYEARAIETDLGSKGTWYRVYAGSYPTSAEAERVRDILLQLPDYSFAQVRRLPRP